METIEYSTIDKSAWHRGEWTNEPDKKQWRDEETGFPCLIVRNSVGALCGYVGVSPEHPLHGKDYDWSMDIDVHGGLTFAGGCSHGDDPSRGICHIPGKGEPDNIWWFGFDCAHSGDLCPSPSLTRYSGFGIDDRYRSLNYVTREVQSLAKQLKMEAGL